MIDFNRAPYLGTEVEYMQQAIANAKLCGDGPFTKKCSQLMKEQFGTKHVLLTTPAHMPWRWQRFSVI